MADKTNTMTKTEARECRSFIKERYAYINGELATEANRVKADIREQIDAESEAEIKRARAAVDKLRKKAQKLEDEARALLNDLRDEGFNLAGYRSDAILSFSIKDDFEVVDQQKRLRAATQVVDNQVDAARRTLKEQEFGATEKLTLNMMDSDEAKEFVKSIPAPSSLVQMPDLKQITA